MNLSNEFNLFIAIFIWNTVSQSAFAMEHRLIPHMDTKDKKVEYYIQKPALTPSKGVILYIHSHQPDNKIGAKIVIERGIPEVYTNLGFTFVAVSQPGYGASEGPPDFCGSFTQNAIISVINHLNETEKLESSQIILIGKSRGATVASMVATKIQNLKGIVLIAGMYDLKIVTDERSVSNFTKEAGINETTIIERSALYHADKMKCPALLIHGYYDIHAPIQAAFSFYKALMGGNIDASLHVFSCGHKVPEENYDDIIINFLKKLTQ
ncbi:MAG: prolyl oligopeptidase family serine peptidase [Alphaproteobacteria bacterium]|nr:prolyl oligopeptidase family serine peptidase [Alphaproteobacteria bacterium]